MAEPVRATRRHHEAPPPFDHERVERAVRLQRARREARIVHAEESRIARARFHFVLAALFVLALVLAFAVWREIQHMFGL